MRVIVCGSRSWTDREKIADRLFELPVTSTVVHGGAGGADRIAHQEAQKLGLLVEVHRPDYEGHSKKYAPIARNEHMAALGADLCIAFWDGRSTGTAHMVDCAEKHGIELALVT